MFFIPSVNPEAASSTPDIGFTTRPTKPLPTPLKNPVTPPFFAPLKGYKKTPVIPLATPENMEVAP